MKMRLGLVITLCFFAAWLVPVYAGDQIVYVSQPDAVTIFLNNVAFVHDQLTVVGSAEVQVTLPAQVYPETLIVREADGRTPLYSVSQSSASGQPTLKLPGNGTSDVRELTLEYLTGGLGWQPNYTMAITSNQDDSVQFDFFAAIQNNLVSLEDVDVKLVAARVDVSQALNTASAPTTNQYIAGYDNNAAQGALSTGPITVQYVYPLGKVTTQQGETTYIKLLEQGFPSRRLLLWNASSDSQVTVIYKVRDDSSIPFTEGIVHSYQDGLFVGSDFVEFTPIGSEGSITVGSLQDVRVNRSESITALDSSSNSLDTLHEVTLTINNFSDRQIDLDVVDQWNRDGREFVFSQEPARESGNLFRWQVSVSAGETVTITYQYKATY
jgi:hypothetical protein